MLDTPAVDRGSECTGPARAGVSRAAAPAVPRGETSPAADEGAVAAHRGLRARRFHPEELLVPVAEAGALARAPAGHRLGSETGREHPRHAAALPDAAPIRSRTSCRRRMP